LIGLPQSLAVVFIGLLATAICLSCSAYCFGLYKSIGKATLVSLAILAIVSVIGWYVWPRPPVPNLAFVGAELKYSRYTWAKPDSELVCIVETLKNSGSATAEKVNTQGALGVGPFTGLSMGNGFPYSGETGPPPLSSLTDIPLNSSTTQNICALFPLDAEKVLQNSGAVSVIAHTHFTWPEKDHDADVCLMGDWNWTTNSLETEYFGLCSKAPRPSANQQLPKQSNRVMLVATIIYASSVFGAAVVTLLVAWASHQRDGT
jgi:hypothetical protein